METRWTVCKAVDMVLLFDKVEAVTVQVCVCVCVCVCMSSLPVGAGAFLVDPKN